jgi:hypothetical protein
MSSLAVTMFSSVANQAPAALGDIADPRAHSVLQGITREQERTLQVFIPTRAAQPVIFDRDTRINRFAVQVQKLHATLGAALLYIGTHPDTVPATGNAKFEQDTSSVWLIGCGIDSVRLVQRIGVTTVFEYSFVGGYWSTAAPINN